MLEKRVLDFKNEDYKEHEELFRELGANGQSPHTLFVTCMDSRVVPTMLTKSKPGELFILRNIANIIPPYKPEQYLETISGLEYAMATLEIKNIIICGHSNCGGCAALYKDLNKPGFEASRKWLALLSWIPQQFRLEKDLAKRALLTEQMSLISSYTNLCTYPIVKEKNPKISLWHYDIPTGKVASYDFEKSEFSFIEKD